MDKNNNAKVYAFQLGYCVLHFSIFHEKMLDKFRSFLVDPQNDKDVIIVGEYEKSEYQRQFPLYTWDTYAEYKCLLSLCADAMLKYDQLIFHSAAVLINDQVWLLSGPSGTGKSTQYRNLKKLYPDKIQIISGDNPVLVFDEDVISVFPSPWNGKENWGSMLSGNLTGIILLNQAKENRIASVSPQKAVIPVYNQINTYAKTEEHIHMLASLEERLITSVPIYTFENTGDPESSRMLYEQLLSKHGGTDEV